MTCISHKELKYNVGPSNSNMDIAAAIFEACNMQYA